MCLNSAPKFHLNKLKTLWDNWLRLFFLEGGGGGVLFFAFSHSCDLEWRLKSTRLVSKWRVQWYIYIIRPSLNQITSQMSENMTLHFLTKTALISLVSITLKCSKNVSGRSTSFASSEKLARKWSQEVLLCTDLVTQPRSRSLKVVSSGRSKWCL